MTGNNKRAAIDWFDRKVLHYVLFWAQPAAWTTRTFFQSSA